MRQLCGRGEQSRCDITDNKNNYLWNCKQLWEQLLSQTSSTNINNINGPNFNNEHQQSFTSSPTPIKIIIIVIDIIISTTTSICLDCCSNVECQQHQFHQKLNQHRPKIAVFCPRDRNWPPFSDISENISTIFIVYCPLFLIDLRVNGGERGVA